MRWPFRREAPADASPVGAEARFQRANQNNEVKGYTFAYKGFADDNNDPNTALSEARQGAERARAELTWEASAAAHVALYEELV